MSEARATRGGSRWAPGRRRFVPRLAQGPPHARGTGSEGARRGSGGQLIVRAPSCAPRGGSVRGEHCPQPGGLEAGTGWGTGAKETGSLILSGPRPGSSPGPGAAPGSPTPDGKFGAGLDLGRCCGIGFPRRGPPPVPLGRRVVLESQLLSPADRPILGWSTLPAAATRGGQGLGATAGTPRTPPPIPGPSRFHRSGRSWGWRRRCAARLECAAGSGRAWGKGQRECWGGVGTSGGEPVPSPRALPALGPGPTGGVRRPGSATLPAPLLCLRSNPRSWGRGGRGGGQGRGLGGDLLFWGEQDPGFCVSVLGLGGLERRK